MRGNIRQDEQLPTGKVQEKGRKDECQTKREAD